MADFESIEEMVGTIEAAAVATESGGTVATVGDEAAATGRVMYTSTSAMLKRWWGRLEKRRMATESGGDETGDPRDETDGHVMQHNIKILFYFINILFTNRFSQFLLQKNQQ